MVVVSENILYFKLENIKSDQDLMVIMSKVKSSLINTPDPSNKIMVIKIQEVVRDDSTMIPKLEYKDSG